MTTTTKSHEEIVDAIYPELTSLIFGVAVMGEDETKVPAGLTSLMPKSGRANLRAKIGTGTTTKPKAKAIVNIEAIEGAEKYQRPNGDFYFSRAWGEHSDVEVLRKARANNQFVLLYGAPGLAKLLSLRARSQMNFTQSWVLATPNLATSLVAMSKLQVVHSNGWTEFW